MRDFFVLASVISLISSAAAAQSTTCQTDDPSCQGYTEFGPSGEDRCISIRGQTRSDFCEKQGETQRVLIHSGDNYCAVPGSDPVPDQCSLHPIVVTEPQ